MTVFLDPITINIPSFSLVCLVGASGSGKSTFANQHFRPTEIISSDHFRAMIADDEADQTVSADAFSCVYHLAKKRLKNHRLTVIDATSVHSRSRQRLLRLAMTFQCPAIAIILNLSLESCLAMNQARISRQVPPSVVEKQRNNLLESLPGLKNEGFARIFEIESHEAALKAKIIIEPPIKKI
ncbi:MAG: AAA family ATPase [Deltaproteobacteria bacterium]|jgi:predicted kinase|nr:AAA family ATPase [Deltaproteobacteria bacterium]